MFFSFFPKGIDESKLPRMKDGYIAELPMQTPLFGVVARKKITWKKRNRKKKSRRHKSRHSACKITDIEVAPPLLKELRHTLLTADAKILINQHDSPPFRRSFSLKKSSCVVA
jgi:hypothetical protein